MKPQVKIQTKDGKYAITATYDDDEATGHGSTKIEAIADLLDSRDHAIASLLATESVEDVIECLTPTEEN
jgi:hypothetical protein